MSEKLHIIPQSYVVNRDLRMHKKQHNAFVIWFTGLSGSGKSTLANGVEKMLFENGIHTYLLDGDNVRTGLNADLDFSEAGRVENIRRIGEVAKLFVDAGIVVLTAFVSPFKADRALAKKVVGTDNFIEIFVDCPLEICEQRDVKGLYKKARTGEISNFTGISSPFEIPENPDLRIDTHLLELEEAVLLICNKISKKLTLNNEY